MEDGDGGNGGIKRIIFHPTLFSPEPQTQHGSLGKGIQMTQKKLSNLLFLNLPLRYVLINDNISTLPQYLLRHKRCLWFVVREQFQLCNASGCFPELFYHPFEIL